MAKYAEIDMTNFPVVIIKYNSQEPTLTEFKEYLSDMDKMYKTEGKRVVIFDASNTKYLSSELRIEQGKWMRENRELLKSKVNNMIFVIPNILVQIIFKGILIVEPLPVDYKLAKNMSEALEIANESLSLA